MAFYCIARKLVNTAVRQVKRLLEVYIVRYQKVPVNIDKGLLLTSKPMLEKLSKPSIKLGNDFMIPVKCLPYPAIPIELTCLVPYKKEELIKSCAKSKSQDFSNINGVIRLYHSTAYLNPPEEDIKKTIKKRLEKFYEVGEETGFFKKVNKARLDILEKVMKAKPPEKDPPGAHSETENQKK